MLMLMIMLVLVRNFKIVANLFYVVVVIGVVVGLACIYANCWFYTEYSSTIVIVIIHVFVVRGQFVGIFSRIV